ncbi:MAG: PD40 domain-containing protein [Acidobacteria bacterium]|nr:PD40 domain-containing protein [Acidobacteriota bacterium]
MPVRSRSPRGRFLPAWILAGALVAGQAGVQAQTQMIPYYGKNNIHYDTFDWHIYTTDHFEIYYYPELEKHLERVAGYAESAYQQVSADLKHDLSFKVQLILFKTHSEFEQQNVEPSAAQEGVGAFAEPIRQRMLMPIDDPPDLLYGLIVHELTHQFEFDIIPQQLIRRGVPLWVNEGLSEYERGQWAPMDLMSIRDAAVADIVPKMSETDGYGDFGSPRFVPYNLGHAVFEFIEARFGKEGIRQFMFSLRKSVIGGGDDAYQEAFQMKPEEFDQAFERYLKDRFKPFRDKERPADYGPNLAPNAEKTHYAEAFSIAPSPSGDLIAAMTINRKDQEIDVVLLSAQDGSIVRNLTTGFDKDRGYDHIVQYGDRFEMPWLGWSPKGDRIAYFVRTEKERTLILQNVLTRDIAVRLPMTMVDEPESPAFSPDGSTIAFSALSGGIGDIFLVDLQTRQVTNVTNDAFADMGPTYSPDGKYLVYASRVSGNQKLFRIDLATKTKTQLTFGTNDETAAKFVDDHTLVFASTATDPAVPLDPDVAKNGNIYNIWTLDLSTAELKQYTDVLGGNWSPVVLADGQSGRIAFISYYKGEFALQAIERKTPLHTAASADFGAPGPIIDFQAPLQHTLIRENARRKKMFEKMFLEGRPPINVGVTSNGDILGGSQVSFGDVLGDKQFNLLAESIQQYRTLAFSYVNLSRRFQFAVQGYSQTRFFYALGTGLYYGLQDAAFISRDNAVATQTSRGGLVFGIYPVDRYRRLELSGGIINIQEQYNNPTLEEQTRQYQLDRFGQTVFRNGSLMPLGAAFVQETTVFREFGPLAGNTMRVAYNASPNIGGLLSRQTFDADLRHYLRLGGSGLLATRVRGFKSFGAYPDFLYFGGNSEMHGYDYLEFTGQNAFFANAELRFPLIEAMLTPLGVMGGVRGVFFFNAGAGWFENQARYNPCASAPDLNDSFHFAARAAQSCTPIIGVQTDASGQPMLDANGRTIPLTGPPQLVSGFRLQDGRASYGLGLETFALGFPIHFDWSWRTLFNKAWEDVLFATQGGSARFRDPRFAVWIGYDF